MSSLYQIQAMKFGEHERPLIAQKRHETYGDAVAWFMGFNARRVAFDGFHFALICEDKSEFIEEFEANAFCVHSAEPSKN